MNKVIENISRRDFFRVECQKCKCKKVSVQIIRGRFSDEPDDFYFVCNHCGNKMYLNI